MIWLRSIGLCLPLLWLAACSPSAERSETLQDGLLYCAEGNPESFNPQLVTSGTTLDMTAPHLYNRLIDYDDDEQQFVASLATSWTVSDDGTRYRFKLRDDVSFHETSYFQPSRYLNSEDIRFSFQRWLDREHPFHAISTTGYPFFTSIGLDKLITAVNTLGEHEIEIKLSQPDSSFLANLASDFAVILSAEYAGQLLQREQAHLIDLYPIGTGPFKYQSFRKDVSLRYESHAEYWDGAASIQRLVFRIIPSDHKRMLMLLTGDCDIIPYPPARDISDLEQNEDIQLYSTVSPNTAFWAFNTQRPPFDDVRVRQALIHAIDRRAIVNAVYFDHAALAQSILPNTSWAHFSDEEAFSYDPEIARELLADAGYGNGFSMNIWAMPVQRAYNPNARKMAELMQADLARIGVEVNIISYEWSTFRRRLVDGDHDSVLIGWSADNPDPDNFFRPLLSCDAVLSGSNRAHWCNPAFDEMVGQAIATADQNQRQVYYQQAQELLNDQVPLMPIVHSLRYLAAQPEIKGIQLQPYGSIQLHRAYKEDIAAEEQP
ncbi:ABC transporter substrate-binding protein [Aliidiomarina minuta]|uniref:ABC transporter substrate-binding protein n=1 Tax=Aliidiomarina minuta TaxID=880057 RepID=A0A432W6U5_9GAMM|nr:ABC transporter substrate-binding protein [Aliidiomarina minuta]RUO25795.1 ABC transporter substrate-binding protein [Aliidiomarina minuta]